MLKMITFSVGLIIVAFLSHTAHAEDGVKISFDILRNGLDGKNLQVFFNFFNTNGEFQVSPSFTVESKKKSNLFQSNLFRVEHIFTNGPIDEDFYFFGKLTSSDGSGEILGFLPLTLVKAANYSVGIRRKEIYLGIFRIALFGNDTIELTKTTCWNNTQQELSGQAARESYPFVGFTRFTTNNTEITLHAITTLVKHRFINTCPTWNRVRGLLRDDLSVTFNHLSPDDVNKILEKLYALYSLTAMNEDWREVPKILNDVLLKMLQAIADMKISGRQVGDIAFEKHQELVRNQLNRLFWRLDDILRIYKEQERYMQCLQLFSLISESIRASKYALSLIEDSDAVDESVYRVFSVSTECASLFAGSEELKEIAIKASSSDIGKDYMNKYIKLYEDLDVRAGRLFPERSSSTKNPLAVKEIKKYYKGFRCNLGDVSDFPGGCQ